MNESNYYYNKNLKEFAKRLRKQSTKAEIKLWNDVLRGKQMHGYSFLRQRPVSSFIADFMCKELMLIIEVDGFTHEWEEQWDLDKKRQGELENLGFTFLRFTDEEVLNDIRNVERIIEEFILDHPPVPLQRGNAKTKT
jgi:very-short-patch-repair endonuclease